MEGVIRKTKQRNFPRLLNQLYYRSLGRYISAKFFKFLVVGGTCFIFDTCVFISLSQTILTDKASIAKTIAVLTATILSFILNKEWSFKGSRNSSVHHEAFFFFAISGIGLLLNVLPVYISRNLLNLDPDHVARAIWTASDFISGQIIGTTIAMAFRWWAFNKFVFTSTSTRNTDVAEG